MNNHQSHTTNLHSSSGIQKAWLGSPQANVHYWQPGEEIEIDSGKYWVVKILGKGGFGITYLVKNHKNQHLVLKTIKPSCQNHPDIKDFREYLRKEAKALYRVDFDQSPHIVKVIHHTALGDLPFLLMEYVEGNNLQGRTLSVPLALKYIRQIAESLIPLHHQGVINRDIKPANIIERENEKDAVLVDFGTARNYQKETTLSIFTSGIFTPPEQAYRDTQGAYTDIYALGMTLYALITGNDRVAPYHQALSLNGSKKLREAIAQAIDPKPSNRPQSLTEWLKLLPLPEHEQRANTQIQGQHTKCQSQSLIIRSTELSKKTPTTMNKSNDTPILIAALAITSMILMAGFGLFQFWRSANSSKNPINNPSDKEETQPILPQKTEVRFYCIFEQNQGQEIPLTVIDSDNYKEPLTLIEWKPDNNYFGEQWNPKTRCEKVSQNFQKIYDRDGLEYIQTDIARWTDTQSNVVCGVKTENSICEEDDVLFTLEHTDKPDEILRNLMGFRENPSINPPLLRGEKYRFKIGDLLKPKRPF